MSLPRRRIVVGDALETLRQLPAGQIDSVVTSPPYFRLRNYGHAGQIGLEDHVDQWVEQLRQVSKEVARILHPRGTYWLNIGDTYALNRHQGASGRKGLVLAPDRLAVALNEDGWLIRNKIIWAKTNHTPSSVTDRLTCSYEVILLLVRSPKYYFDLHSIRTPHRSRPPTRSRQLDRPPRGGGEGWRGPNTDGNGGGLDQLKRQGLIGHPLGRNPGDVWSMSVSNYRGAHFATFPQKLAEQMIQAGTPVKRCRSCLSPWTRKVRRLGATATRLALAPTCDCQAASEPGIVLDPFMGAGTTAIAAQALGRDWLGVEINPAFATQARARIRAATDPR